MKTITDKAREYANQSIHSEDNSLSWEHRFDAFLAGAKEATRWISVNDELPEEGITVLVKQENGTAVIGVWKGRYWQAWGPVTPGSQLVKYWRPIELITE